MQLHTYCIFTRVIGNSWGVGKESEESFDSEYDFSEHKIDEQIVDTDSEKQSSETIIQKGGGEFSDRDYKVFTKEFDEISKAENLERELELLDGKDTKDDDFIG